ncbi:hypothetical protein [Radicibacter daui]|uniref:hypothetical protein n=1 Tax=Radicibacter daui TaxID=3064829 RepID=UPI0040469176
MAVNSISNPAYNVLTPSGAGNVSTASGTGSSSSSSSSTSSDSNAADPLAGTDDFTRGLAESNPDLTSALTTLRTTSSLLGLADSSVNTALFNASSSASNPYLSVLSAAYLDPINEAYGNFLKTQAGSGSDVGSSTVELTDNVSAVVTGVADAGNYTVSYDKDKKQFSITDGTTTVTTALPTANSDGTRTLDFKNGITLNIGKGFNANADFEDQAFSVSYADDDSSSSNG